MRAKSSRRSSEANAGYIWSAKEADRWQEAYLLGNGRMGAAVYGGVFEETVDLSEITFFSGSPSSENNQKGAAWLFRKCALFFRKEKKKRLWKEPLIS